MLLTYFFLSFFPFFLFSLFSFFSFFFFFSLFCRPLQSAARGESPPLPPSVRHCIECTPVAGVAGRSHLRSAASGDILVPACQTLTIGPRAFIVACPRAWNSLPMHLRRPGISLPVFKKELKTELFRRMLDGKR